MNYEGAPGLELGNENCNVDPSVAAVLPLGCRVVSTGPFGTSFWASTGRIDVELLDGTVQSFFIKVMSQDTGKNMARGEFESMTVIYAIQPDFAPKPIAWGSYETIPNTHFFLCQFRHMIPEVVPSPSDFPKLLAALHKGSASPTGKFGFHVTTYNGNLPQFVEWENRAYDAEFDVLLPALFEKVIPRLLRPLESDGRSVKPCLVHGDLWYANSGLDEGTKKPLVFDACCFYAHNEYEFGQWLPKCNKFEPEHLAAYNEEFPISEPIEDYDGRLNLYKLKFNTHVSALFPKNLSLREQMLGDLRDLVKRYS